jgi:hypothetical protein
VHQRLDLVSAILACAIVLGGCASWHLEPYNGQALCEVAGGTYTADGRCLAGNVD